MEHFNEVYKMLEKAAGSLEKKERIDIINHLLTSGKYTINEIAAMTDKEIILEKYNGQMWSEDSVIK